MEYGSYSTMRGYYKEARAGCFCVQSNAQKARLWQLLLTLVSIVFVSGRVRLSGMASAQARNALKRSFVIPA